MDQDDVCANIAEENKNKIENAKIYLDVVRSEFEYETQRKTSIENRVGFFLTLVGALAVLLLTIFKLPSIDINKINQLDILMLAGSTLFIGFIYFFLIRAVYYFFKVLDVEGYERIDVNDINETSIIDERLIALMKLIIAYKNATITSRKQNQIKCSKYTNSIKNLSIGLILTIIYITLSNLLVLGGLAK